MIEFLNPGGRGFTVPIAATLASAASRACSSGVKSAAPTPSSPRAPSGERARIFSRTSRITAVSSSSRTFAAPRRGDFRADAAARRKFADQRRRMRARRLYDIGQHPVHGVFLKDTQISIRNCVHFERFQLQTALIWHISKRENAGIGQAGFGANRGKLRHDDLDFIAGGELVRPGFDFGQIGFDAGLGVFVGILAFHFLAASPRTPSISRDNRSRNNPTSVTTPIAWPVPRSLTLAATAGLISTQTIFTQLGSMLPTAIECSIDPQQSTNPAPCNCPA